MISRFPSAALLPVVFASALLVAAPTMAFSVQHAKPRAAAHKHKAAAAAEPATTTDANGQSVPVLANKAWVLMDFNTGWILASSNPDEPLPPASLTKMMTSYLVEQGLKSGKLKPDELVPRRQGR